MNFNSMELTPRTIAELYPRLFSEKRFKDWGSLFDPQAMVVRVEYDEPVTCINIYDSMSEQIEYAEENERFIEEWKNVTIEHYGNIAVIKADYYLIVDKERREGVDVLTLVNKGKGWKIVNLTYEQTKYTSL